MTMGCPRVAMAPKSGRPAAARAPVMHLPSAKRGSKFQVFETRKAVVQNGLLAAAHLATSPGPRWTA
jgi:hypothetical protein